MRTALDTRAYGKVLLRGGQVSPAISGRHFARRWKRETQIERGPRGRTVLREEVRLGTPETAAGGRAGVGGNATGWSPFCQRAEGPPGTSLGSWCTLPPPGGSRLGRPGAPGLAGAGGRQRAGLAASTPPRQVQHHRVSPGDRRGEARHLGLLDTGGNLGGLGAYRSICGSRLVTCSAVSGAGGSGKS